MRRWSFIKVIFLQGFHSIRTPTYEPLYRTKNLWVFGLNCWWWCSETSAFTYFYSDFCLPCCRVDQLQCDNRWPRACTQHPRVWRLPTGCEDDVQLQCGVAGWQDPVSHGQRNCPRAVLSDGVRGKGDQVNVTHLETELFGEGSFSYTAPHAWNCLLQTLCHWFFFLFQNCPITSAVKIHFSTSCSFPGSVSLPSISGGMVSVGACLQCIVSVNISDVKYGVGCCINLFDYFICWVGLDVLARTFFQGPLWTHFSLAGRWRKHPIYNKFWKQDIT